MNKDRQWRREDREFQELVFSLEGRRPRRDRLVSILTWLSVGFLALYMAGCIHP